MQSMVDGVGRGEGRALGVEVFVQKPVTGPSDMGLRSSAMAGVPPLVPPIVGSLGMPLKS